MWLSLKSFTKNQKHNPKPRVAPSISLLNLYEPTLIVDFSTRNGSFESSSTILLYKFE